MLPSLLAAFSAPRGVGVDLSWAASSAVTAAWDASSVRRSVAAARAANRKHGMEVLLWWVKTVGSERALHGQGDEVAVLQGLLERVAGGRGIEQRSHAA